MSLQNTQIFALEPQVFLYFLNFSVFSVFLHWSKCFCIYRPDRSRLFAFKGEREVVLHNRETEFRTNKQQRGANLNKVTELEHKKSAPWKLNLFSTARSFSVPARVLRAGEVGWQVVEPRRWVLHPLFFSSFWKEKLKFPLSFFPLFVFKETRLTFLFIIPSISFLLFWRMTIHVFM